MSDVLPRAVAAALILTLGSGLAGAGAPATASASPVARPEATTTAAATTTATGYQPHVFPDGTLRRPPWWQGLCDGASSGNYPGSRPLGASWDGLTACGPGPTEGGWDHLVQFFPEAWGEYEWECVELSMRWMYLAWGIPPYPADGNTIADNYAANNPYGPKLQLIPNGTRGIAPQPGDVLELQIDGTNTPGHTEVVTSSHVNAQGDGSVQVMTENIDNPTNGWYTLSVSNWVVDGGFGSVVDWLHDPAWALEEPLVSEVDPSGNLGTKVDRIGGSFTVITGGVAQGLVIGGGGSNPAPIEVVLTTNGAVEARVDLPGQSWRVLTPSGATQIAAAAGERRGNGRPTIGWLTNGGAFELTQGLSPSAVREATNVTDIAIGSDSPTKDPVVGYVSNRSAYVKVGGGSFRRVATGVRILSLAADRHDPTEPVIGYLGVSGRAFVRQGLTGKFTAVGPTQADSIAAVAVAAVGAAALPLVGYVTTSGAAYASLGTGRAVEEQRSGATAIAVAGGENVHGFPLVAVQSTDGSWSVIEGSLTARPHPQGTAPQLSLSTIVVS